MMKKFMRLFFVVLCLLISVLFCSAGAVDIDDEDGIVDNATVVKTEEVNIEPHAMPVPFEYVNFGWIDSTDSLVPGYAEFEIVISGTIDVQRNYIIDATITVEEYKSLNLGDFSISTKKLSYSPNSEIINYTIKGTATFEYTEPNTGAKLRKTEKINYTDSFDATDYT